MSIESIVLTGIALAGAIVAISFPHQPSIHRAAVGLVLVSAALVVGVLLTADHIAAARHAVPQSMEWQRGATDTRNAVMSVLPILGSSLLALSVLVLIPPRRSH
jgi:hypothetical protein